MYIYLLLLCVYIEQQTHLELKWTFTCTYYIIVNGHLHVLIISSLENKPLLFPGTYVLN